MMQRKSGDVFLLAWQRFLHAKVAHDQFDWISCRQELFEMPEAEFLALCGKVTDKDRSEFEAWEEQNRFFNLPNAKVDFSHWSKAAEWTLDEATALSFGKHPQVVNWEEVEEYVGASAFADRYAGLRDLIKRAKNRGQLCDPIHPASFITWAKQNDIDFPPELEAAVLARAGKWQSPDDIQKQLAAERKAHEGCKAQLFHVEQQLDQLRQQNSNLQTELASRDSKKDNLHPKVRESLLTLVIAMAIKGYSYKPSAARSDVPAEIAKDVNAVGLSINRETVLTRLREAADLLPFIAEK